MGENKNKIAEYLKADKVLDSLTSYIEVNIELLKLEVRDAVTNSVSKAIEYVVLAIFLSMIFIFISITAALFINFYFKTSAFVGFGVVTLFYSLILAIYFLVIKRALKKRIAEKVEQSIQVKTIETLSQVQKQLEGEN